MKPSAKRQLPLLGSLALASFFTVQIVGAAQELPNIFSHRAQNLAALRQGFAQPPREAGPWAFWFCWNSVVSREEIARELEELAAAGFGGAEIRIVTFHGWKAVLDQVRSVRWSPATTNLVFQHRRVRDGDEAGLLYERGDQFTCERITYARFSLRWLAAGDEKE